MDRVISDSTFDQERALYHLQNTTVRNCVFAENADGESALKEARDIVIEDCSFSLRYPLWHVCGFRIDRTVMESPARAALWYCTNGEIANSVLHGIKAVRECNDVSLCDCRISSDEFGWKCDHISVKNCDITSDYLFLDSKNVDLHNVSMHGKYSFQYMEDLTITDSVLDTKDAFWHSENVTVKNCTVMGEYLGWFSRGLTLIDCTIIGTQPLCYCTDLRLINCKTEGCDLAFEYSDVEADIRGSIDSVKNPRSGHITADRIGEIIREDPVMPCGAEIVIR